VKNLRRGDTSISEKKETFSIRQEERPVTRLAASMERKSSSPEAAAKGHQSASQSSKLNAIQKGQGDAETA